jgi:hypothetical protein
MAAAGAAAAANGTAPEERYHGTTFALVDEVRRVALVSRHSSLFVVAVRCRGSSPATQWHQRCASPPWQQCVSSVASRCMWWTDPPTHPAHRTTRLQTCCGFFSTRSEWCWRRRMLQHGTVQSLGNSTTEHGRFIAHASVFLCVCVPFAVCACSRQVTFTGYSIPHPTEHVVNIRVQTNGGCSRPRAHAGSGRWPCVAACGLPLHATPCLRCGVAPRVVRTHTQAR